MGSRDSSSGCADCCATRAANGSADNRAGRGAARRLSGNFSVNRRCRNSNQEQKRQRFLHFYTCSLFGPIAGSANTKAPRQHRAVRQNLSWLTIQHSA